MQRSLRVAILSLASAGVLGLAACSGAPATAPAASSTSAPTAAAQAAKPAAPAASAPASSAATSPAAAAKPAATTAAPAAAATNAPAAAAKPTGAASTVRKVNANTASIAEIQAALEAAGVSNAARWAREVDEYRPYAATDTNFTKLRGELTKYNPTADTVEKIISALSL